MYTPCLSILSLLKDFEGKVSIDFLVSRTGMKRADLEKSLEDLGSKGVILREGDTVHLVKHTKQHGNSATRH